MSFWGFTTFSNWRQAISPKSLRVTTTAAALLLLLLSGTSVYAQTLTRDQLIASYLYNFIKQVEWPSHAEQQSLSIGVYKTADPRLSSKLQNHFRDTRLHGLPVDVTRLYTLDSINEFNVLYIEQADETELESVYKALAGKPILLVTSNFANQQLVMINLLSTEDNRIRFEVNKANMLNHGLQPKPDIILNGGSEIDVAKLFREGQASLVTMQKQLRDREKLLGNLEADIARIQQENRQLTSNLQRLRAEIVESQRKLEESKHYLEQHQLQLKQQDHLLKSVEQEKQTLEEEVARKTSDLNKRQQLLDQIGSQISRRENQLRELNDTIINQKSKIIELDDVIATQGIVLNNLIALIVLSVILIGVTIWAYVNKRRDAERLELHGRELKIARDRLAIAKTRAEEANQAKSEFLSLMSHELRTPLQAIIGYTDVVIEELKLEGMDTHTQDLNRVVNNSERLLRLINGVLDLAKIESGHIELHLAPVNLKAVVQDAVANVRPQFEEKHLALSIQTDNGPEYPVADQEKLLHIVLNLLSNACKFTDTGVVKIIAEHRTDHIYISVQDTGSGIPEDQLPYVFERFRQADSSATRRHQGSGLGLSITKQFCELMGGHIEVHSELNLGTTFILKIPLPVRQMSQQMRQSMEDDIRELEISSDEIVAVETDSRKLLMIDDDTEFLHIMARTMRKAGYTVYTATTASEGLKIARDLCPDIITLDLLLPDMHGWELFQTIKQEPELNEIPIIIASVIDDRQRSEEMGADQFLTKPVARTALKLAVEKLQASLTAN